MTARILVVDDILSNVKLLEAKLSAEYFEVITAFNGLECLARMEETIPDLVLLDVMMPGMDGFEVCRRIKSNPKTAHVPVVIVAALDQPSDRVAGLDAGADDFLTKPVDDTALFARVRSLVRLKMMTDELRVREAAGQGMGLIDPAETLTENNQSGRILIVEDRAESVARFNSALTPTHTVSSADTFEEALVRVKGGDFDLIVVSLGMHHFDGLRLCSQLRSLPEGRHVPILVLVSDGDRRKLTQALEMGVNDYLTRPVDKNELVARVRTQLRKKRYADRLRHNVQLSLEMAITDQLTGLHNRRYMSRHLDTLLADAKKNEKPLALALIDISRFKAINENYSRAIGDEVLKEFASRIGANVRGIDLASRYMSDQFAIAMPDTDLSFARNILSRFEAAIKKHPIKISTAAEGITISVQIGLVSSSGRQETADQLFERAEAELRKVKKAKEDNTAQHQEEPESKNAPTLKDDDAEARNDRELDAKARELDLAIRALEAEKDLEKERTRNARLRGRLQRSETVQLRKQVDVLQRGLHEMRSHLADLSNAAPGIGHNSAAYAISGASEAVDDLKESISTSSPDTKSTATAAKRLLDNLKAAKDWFLEKFEAVAVELAIEQLWRLIWGLAVQVSHKLVAILLSIM